MNMIELAHAIAKLPIDTEIRIGDVSEGHDLHCSVGAVVVRNGCVVLVPGDDDVWRDETLSSEVLMERIWPLEEGKDDSA